MANNRPNRFNDMLKSQNTENKKQKEKPPVYGDEVKTIAREAEKTSVQEDAPSIKKGEKAATVSKLNFYVPAKELRSERKQILLTKEQSKWLDQTSKLIGISMNELISQLINNAMNQ